MTATVEGQDVLIRRMKAVIRIVRQEVGKVNRDVAYKGVDRARQLVPVRTGALLASLDVVGGGMTWRFGSINYEGRAPVPIFVEYGINHPTAHPYLRPSEEAARTALPQGTRLIARQLPGLVAKA